MVEQVIPGGRRDRGSRRPDRYGHFGRIIGQTVISRDTVVNLAGPVPSTRFSGEGRYH